MGIVCAELTEIANVFLSIILVAICVSKCVLGNNVKIKVRVGFAGIMLKLIIT